ncbi:unnamed protein product [Urochloa humidicola]
MPTDTTFSRPSDPPAMPSATMQPGTEMAFAAIHHADEVPQRNERCGAPAYERRALAAWLASDEVRRRSLRQSAREHLFHKALTPSDVGSLNRLVVLKQHAEKHFLVKRNPLMAAGMGVLLELEDGEGKTWRFRYSYCRSSRIYILTRGWRRFVRDKELKAGDTVAFYRSAVGPFNKLHIDYWKAPQKKQDDGVAIGSHVVKLFGVDIARGCPCRQGAKLAIST